MGHCQLIQSQPTALVQVGGTALASARAPVAFTNTQPANTSAAPLNAAAGMAAVVALLSPLPLLQLPRRCLPLSHGRCQYYGHCENAGAVAGGWKMRRRVRSAGRVWMRGQGQRGVSVGESRSGEREGSEGDGCASECASRRTCPWRSRALSLIAHCSVPMRGPLDNGTTPGCKHKCCRSHNIYRFGLSTSRGMHEYGMFGNVFGGDHHHPDWLTTGYDPSPAAHSALWPGATPPRLPSRSDSHGVPESDVRTIYCTHSDNLRPPKSLTWLQRRQTPWQGRAAGWQCTGPHVEWALLGFLLFRPGYYGAV